MFNTIAINKTVVASYALIGAVVITSIIYPKMLERDAARFVKKMHSDSDKINADFNTVFKIHSLPNE